MVTKILLGAVVAMGLMAVPRTAGAQGCTTDLVNCYQAAAQVDSFWYRWAAGLDCELDYAECVRIKLVGA